MIVEASKQKWQRPLWLFYSNRRQEDAPFLSELRETQRNNPNYKLIATLTEPERSRPTWTGETGYIDISMLTKYLGALTSAIYYTAGPPAMVAAMLEMLGKGGVQIVTSARKNSAAISALKHAGPLIRPSTSF